MPINADTALCNISAPYQVDIGHVHVRLDGLKLVQRVLVAQRLRRPHLPTCVLSLVTTAVVFKPNTDLAEQKDVFAIHGRVSHGLANNLLVLVAVGTVQAPSPNLKPLADSLVNKVSTAA